MRCPMSIHGEKRGERGGGAYREAASSFCSDVQEVTIQSRLLQVHDIDPQILDARGTTHPSMPLTGELFAAIVFLPRLCVVTFGTSLCILTLS
jgi:hypothetical protein